MGSAFHQLCPRYCGTLTPTAPVANRLWETFTFYSGLLFLIWGEFSYGRVVLNTGRVVLHYGASCLGPSFNQGKLSWNQDNLDQRQLVSRQLAPVKTDCLTPEMSFSNCSNSMKLEETNPCISISAFFWCQTNADNMTEII